MRQRGRKRRAVGVSRNVCEVEAERETIVPCRRAQLLAQFRGRRHLYRRRPVGVDEGVLLDAGDRPSDAVSAKVVVHDAEDDAGRRGMAQTVHGLPGLFLGDRIGVGPWRGEGEIAETESGCVLLGHGDLAKLRHRLLQHVGGYRRPPLIGREGEGEAPLLSNRVPSTIS